MCLKVIYITSGCAPRAQGLCIKMCKKSLERKLENHPNHHKCEKKIQKKHTTLYNRRMAFTVKILLVLEVHR